MKKTNLIRFLKIMALVIPVLIFVLVSQQYLFYFSNHNAERIRRFYQEENNSLDVVFIGASDVFTGYAPALAYEQYGYTSYMYAMDAAPGGLYRYQVTEVLSRQNPQLIFVEINGFLYDMPMDEHVLRIFTDNIPMSANRLEAIWRFQEDDKLSTVLPFITYHGEWEKGSQLLDQLRWRVSTSRNPALLKGMMTTTEIDTQRPEDIPFSENLAAMARPEDTLEEFLRYCRENGIDNIVFVRFPHKNAEHQRERVEQVEQRILEYGYPFLNLEEKTGEIGLDLYGDYYNPEHLNIYGQKKLTAYLGRCITEDFGLLPMAQSPANARHWETCAAYYHWFYEYAEEHIAGNVSINFGEEYPGFQQFLDWTAQKAP